MLQLSVPGREYFDNNLNEFIDIPAQTLQLEHSLLSIAKWESKWKKPFLSNQPKTMAEQIDYVRCMTTNQHVNQLVYKSLGPKEFKKINAYIEDPMTATTFKREQNRRRGSREVITAEIVYYWMSQLQIPFTCEKWHFNRLMTLIQVASIKNQPPKKMGRKAALKQQHSLNEARRARTGSHG